MYLSSLVWMKLGQLLKVKYSMFFKFHKVGSYYKTLFTIYALIQFKLCLWVQVKYLEFRETTIWVESSLRSQKFVALP